MAKFKLTPDVLDLVADHFRALGEPARLNILNVLRAGEKSVSEIMAATGLGQANVSKHLQLLHALGFVDRRKEGLYVLYSMADEDVFTLCDLMCGRLANEAGSRKRMLRSAAK